MSEFLDGLLRRSRGPLPEAVRPLPRALFEPEMSHVIALEPTAGRDAIDGPITVHAASLDVGDLDASPPRSGPRAATTLPGGSPERGPASPGARTARHWDDASLPAVEPERTVMIPSPAAVPSAPARQGRSSSEGGGPAGRAAIGAPTAEPAGPITAALETRSRPSSPPLVHTKSRSGGELDPGSPSPPAAPPIPADPAAHRPILAGPAAHTSVAARPEGTPRERPSERRPGTVEPSIRPARVGVDAPRIEADGHAGRERAADEPPVIRVTIGRVEVRAVSPPVRATPPPAPRPRQPSLSLGDYLTQRGEGRR